MQKRSEQKLEEDKRSDSTSRPQGERPSEVVGGHDAVKEAEAEATKKKNDKVQEIKRLNQQLQAVSSEMSKQRRLLMTVLNIESSSTD